MTSRIKSALLNRTKSMRQSTAIGLKETIRTHRLNIGDDASYRSNEYIHKRFFDDDNYQSIIKCLDGGYDVATDLIQWLQDYCSLLHEQIHRHNSHSKKWKSNIKQQSSLSSYHTTKRAQLQIIRSSETIAQLLQTRHDAIQRVIADYQKQVDKMYTSGRLSTTHKHCQTDRLKKLFKTLRESLNELSEKLQALHGQEEKAQSALRSADIECENLSLDETASKSTVARATEHQQKKQEKLQVIQEKISRAEKELSQEQETYHEKATVIYNECREYEKERLDQIRQTLIKFTEAAHSSDYSNDVDTVYENLSEDIRTNQNSEADLDFWAQTYHVDGLAKSISSETIDTTEADSQSTTRKTKESTTTVATTENTQQSTVKVEEEQSASDTTATPAKTKVKKTKNTTATEKKNNSTPEPTSPNAT